MARPSLLAPREAPVSAAICHTQPERLVGYWPLSEPRGAAKAIDWSGRGFNGVTANALPGKVGGFGRRGYSFDGTGDEINIYSAALAAKMSVLEGTVIAFVTTTAAAYADGTDRAVINLGADATSNFIRITKTSTLNVFTVYYKAGGSAKSVTISTKNLSPLMVGLTFSKSRDVFLGYWNGAIVGKATALGVWSGALASARCFIGANATATNGYIGTIWDVAVWNAPLTPGEIMDIWRAAAYKYR